MSRSSHSKQREPGLQAPMRPTMAILGIEDAVTVSTDTVNWQNANQLVNVNLAQEFFDDRGILAVNTGDDLSLGEGVWLIEFNPIVAVGTNAAAVEAAITNSGGTTVHAESIHPIEIAANQDAHVTVQAVVHVTSNPTVVQLRLRADAALVTVTDATPCGKVTKIGNANET